MQGGQTGPFYLPAPAGIVSRRECVSSSCGPGLYMYFWFSYPMRMVVVAERWSIPNIRSRGKAKGPEPLISRLGYPC